MKEHYSVSGLFRRKHDDLDEVITFVHQELNTKYKIIVYIKYSKKMPVNVTIQSSDAYYNMVILG